MELENYDYFGIPIILNPLVDIKQHKIAKKEWSRSILMDV